MGLFQEINCVHCGKKTSLLTRKKLRDGQYVCSKCLAGMPSCIKEYLGDGDYNNFKNVKEYMQYSNDELSRVFRETHSYYSLHIDTEHKLFYLSSDHPRTYYKMSELSEFNLEFVPNEVKEGLFSDKVEGKLVITIKMDFPYWFKDEVFENYVSAKAKIKGMINKRALYDNPKGMDDFLHAFGRAWDQAKAEEFARLTSEIESY